MFLRFGVSNHRSIRDYQKLSLVASNLKGGIADLIEVQRLPHKVLPAVLIYGANASGKSNVLDAIETMQAHVLHSYTRASPASSVPVERLLLPLNSRTGPLGLLGR